MAITTWHAHVYFSPEEREWALGLREEARRIPGLQLGRVHDRPVGPHPKPMYQILFHSDQLDRVLPWLVERRRGLGILLHPETGDDLTDHTENALWLGPALPLNLRAFDAGGAD